MVQLSPGIQTREIDLTTVVPAVASTEGCIAGPFRWGPVDQKILIDSEITLVNRFHTPSNFNAETFFSAANFLSYSNRLYVTRVVNGAKNAVSGNNVMAADSVTIKNSDDFENGVETDALFAARYPGALGNSLKVEVCDNAGAFSTNKSIYTIADASDDVDSFGNTSIEHFNISFESGSDEAKITITADSNTNTDAEFSGVLDTITDGLSVGSIIEAGNNSVGRQYIEVTGIGDSNTDEVEDAVATATAIFDSTTGEITRIVVTNSGAGYTENPTVTITGGGGTGATATATHDGAEGVLSITVVNRGTGYSEAPTVTIEKASGNDGLNKKAIRTITLKNAYTLADAQSDNLVFSWKYARDFDNAPGTSIFAEAKGITGDELHVVIVDEDGEINDQPGQVLERFTGLSRVRDAKNASGDVIYYKEVLNSTSDWIYVVNERNMGYTVDSSAGDITLTTSIISESFVGGDDGRDENNLELGDYQRGYRLYANAADVDISLVVVGKSMGGNHGEGLFKYVIDSVCEARKDCVAFGSPLKNDVVNQDNAVDNVIEFRNALGTSSYAVLDSGYKYQYDKYNDVYRWIPLNGDIAGITARTDQLRDPWFSPAGTTRGQIKNVVKLAFNPNKAQRDELYKNSINPVITQSGQGTILFGDKTLLNKPSAFDRINVRRLFIVIEKAISTAAKFTLFEFNNEFTRAQFVNLIEPFLRDVQGREGVTDFRVVCDETNNTAQVIDNNEFVGDIYIKPSRSINFIQLNFVAVRSGVEFSEIVGNF